MDFKSAGVCWSYQAHAGFLSLRLLWSVIRRHATVGYVFRTSVIGRLLGSLLDVPISLSRNGLFSDAPTDCLDFRATVI
jgi:hypothetical protein